MKLDVPLMVIVPLFRVEVIIQLASVIKIAEVELDTINQTVNLRHISRVGLTLTLNIGQDDYVREFGGSAGVRIVVHPQERMPFPSDEGVLAAPGQLSIIGIRQVSYAERLLTAAKRHVLSCDGKPKNVI